MPSQLDLVAVLKITLPPHLRGVVADLTGERHYPVNYCPELTTCIVGCLDVCTASWRSQPRYCASLSDPARNSCLAAANMVFNWFPNGSNNNAQSSQLASLLPPGEVLGRAMLLIVSICRIAGINGVDAVTIVKYLVGTISKITAVAAPQRDEVGPYHDAVYGALRAMCCFSFDVDSELYAWIVHRIVPIHLSCIPTQAMGVAMVLERSAAIRLLPQLHSQWVEGRVEWEVMTEVGSKLFEVAGELKHSGTDPESLTAAYELWKAITAHQHALSEAAAVYAEAILSETNSAQISPLRAAAPGTSGVKVSELMHFLKSVEGRYQNELGCMAVDLKENELVTSALQDDFDRERATSDQLYKKLCEALSAKADTTSSVSVDELAKLALHGAVSSLASQRPHEC